MRAKGNGNPEVCVANLLKLARGECVYERCKGVDTTIFDRPADIAKALLIPDVRWLIQTYEPRVDINSMDVEALLVELGSFAMILDVKVEG